MSAIVEVRFAVTTSTLTCPPGILSRTRARPMLALRVDYELDSRFARMTPDFGCAKVAA